MVCYEAMVYMKLYIIRHAIAIERERGITDEDRYLTPRGRESFRLNAKTFAKKGISLDFIVTSPLVRCVQTADILAEALDFSGELMAARDLAPGFDLQGLYRVISSCAGAQKIAIIGHEPDLGILVESLLKLEGAFSLKKGMIVALDLDPQQKNMPGRLNWIMHKGTKTAEAKNIKDSI
jgi:phosphohistidine phosphatase